MKWLLIEKSIPNDTVLIDDSIKNNIDENRYSPTVEFAKYVYCKFNRELFIGILPDVDEVEIGVSNIIRGGEFGQATCNICKSRCYVEDIKLKLNSSVTLTIHEWLEVMLHEMIHIYDYTINTKKYCSKDGYVEHDEWFNEFSKKFKKFGLVVQPYHTGGHGMNIDNKKISNRISKMLDNEIYFVVNGDKLFKGYIKDKEIILNSLKGKNYKSVRILKSNNPTSAEIPPCIIRSVKSPISYYPFTDEFKGQYGPFDEIETVDLSLNKMNESMDDTDDEFLAHLRNISGMRFAYKVDDDKYQICMG